MFTPEHLTPENILARWRSLVAEMPDLWNSTPDSTRSWIGKVIALSKVDGSHSEVRIQVAVQNYRSILATQNAAGVDAIKDFVFTRLAEAELRAPHSSSGTFIPAKNALDAVSAIGQILTSANTSLLVVDPYLGGEALNKYFVFAKELTPLRLLADASSVKPTLAPAVAAWVKQFADKRPIEARLAPARALHDRVILVDSADAWILTQSFNAFADRSPAAIEKASADSALMKVAAYEQLWQAATPL